MCYCDYIRPMIDNIPVSQKKGAFLFLLELCQISTNFKKFWQEDGKMTLNVNRLVEIAAWGFNSYKLSFKHGK